LLPAGRDSGPLLPSSAKPAKVTIASASAATSSGGTIATCYDGTREGQQTAAGEIYDPAALSASDPNMPLSSLAMITNARTGKEVIVRVNDRPSSGAAMNVSPAVATALGEGESCRLQVTVRRLGSAPLAAPGGQLYRQPAQRSAPEPARATLTSLPTSVSAPVITFIAPATAASSPFAAPVAYNAGSFLVQIGAYSQRANAEAARDRAGSAGPVSIQPAEIGGVSLYRVRLGPWSSRKEAEQARSAAEALGFAGAKITTP
jgi:rare lipoprotein A